MRWLGVRFVALYVVLGAALWLALLESGRPRHARRRDPRADGADAPVPPARAHRRGRAARHVDCRDRGRDGDARPRVGVGRRVDGAPAAPVDELPHRAAVRARERRDPDHVDDAFERAVVARVTYGVVVRARRRQARRCRRRVVDRDSTADRHPARGRDVAGHRRRRRGRGHRVHRVDLRRRVWRSSDEPLLENDAKIGILAASIIAATIGSLVLAPATTATRRAGLSTVSQREGTSRFRALDRRRDAPRGPRHPRSRGLARSPGRHADTSGRIETSARTCSSGSARSRSRGRTGPATATSRGGNVGSNGAVNICANGGATMDDGTQLVGASVDGTNNGCTIWDLFTNSLTGNPKIVPRNSGPNPVQLPVVTAPTLPVVRLQPEQSDHGAEGRGRRTHARCVRRGRVPGQHHGEPGEWRLHDVQLAHRPRRHGQRRFRNRRLQIAGSFILSNGTTWGPPGACVDQGARPCRRCGRQRQRDQLRARTLTCGASS